MQYIIIYTFSNGSGIKKYINFLRNRNVFTLYSPLDYKLTVLKLYILQNLKLFLCDKQKNVVLLSIYVCIFLVNIKV